MTVEAVVFTATGTETHSVDTTADLETARDAEGTTWVKASQATPEEISRIAESYGIHKLEVEDITADIRPKLDLTESHTFILARNAQLRTGETTFEEEIRDQSIGLFVGDGWLVSLSTEAIEPVDLIWDRVLNEESRLLERGPDFVAYRILDRIVDAYFSILDEIETDIEQVEEGIIGEPDPDTLEQINSLRRELLSVRRIVWPMRDVLSQLARGESEYVQESTERYYRDVYDHLVQLVELVVTYRDLAAGSRDIYLNTLSQSTNEVMKRLTVVATIVLPLTFVAGIYGMNFADSPYNMPELGWTFGYPAVLLGMLGTAIVMLAYFRQEDWL